MKNRDQSFPATVDKPKGVLALPEVYEKAKTTSVEVSRRWNRSGIKVIDGIETASSSGFVSKPFAKSQSSSSVQKLTYPVQSMTYTDVKVQADTVIDSPAWQNYQAGSKVLPERKEPFSLGYGVAQPSLRINAVMRIIPRTDEEIFHLFTED